MSNFIKSWKNFQNEAAKVSASERSYSRLINYSEVEAISRLKQLMFVERSDPYMEYSFPLRQTLFEILLQTTWLIFALQAFLLVFGSLIWGGLCIFVTVLVLVVGLFGGWPQVLPWQYPTSQTIVFFDDPSIVCLGLMSAESCKAMLEQPWPISLLGLLALTFHIGLMARILVLWREKRSRRSRELASCILRLEKAYNNQRAGKGLDHQDKSAG